jgi:glycosyltransferase involved in cell wall biosynthesis
VAVDARLLGMTRLGTGRYSTEIMRALLRHARDAEFVFIGPAEIDRGWLPEGTSVYQHVPAGSETLLDAGWEQYTMPTHLVGCDILFSPTGVLPLTKPCPSVVVVHDLGFERNPSDYPDRLRDYLARWQRGAAVRSERVIAVSTATKRDLEELYRIESARIDVVHHGAPEQTVVPEGSADEKPYVLCVSSFEPNKNQAALVEGFRYLGPAWTGDLVLAGRAGRTLPALQALVRQLAIEERVRFAVDISEEELRRLYSKASLFAFPSLFEGFGLPLLEAMSHRLPVVASATSSIPEVVGAAGVLVDEPRSPQAWAHTMKGALLSPERLRWLAEASGARAQEFNWDKAAACTWEILATTAGLP